MIDHESPLFGKVQGPPVKSVLTTFDLKDNSRVCVDDSVTSLGYHEPSGLTVAGRFGGQLTAIRNHRSEEHMVVPGHGPLEAWGVAFSTDGRRLYSVGDDSCLKVWDLPAGTLLASLTEHSTLVSCVAVSPDGRWIATGSYDNTVCLWDASSLKLQYKFTGHTEALKTLVFSPNSQILASAGRGHHIRCWTVSDGQPIRAIPDTILMSGVLPFCLKLPSWRPTLTVSWCFIGVRSRPDCCTKFLTRFILLHWSTGHRMSRTWSTAYSQISLDCRNHVAGRSCLEKIRFC